jgi:hypothetical protein
MFETTNQYSNVEIDGILQITIKLIGIYSYTWIYFSI